MVESDKVSTYTHALYRDVLNPFILPLGGVA